MKISGFTMCKNADKLYYPIKAVIESALPIVDEFVVALGDCDSDDNTRDQILSIKSEKIKIIDTVWDIAKFSRGTENAHQTDIAKSHCSGDWLFYLQADEVVHEKFLPVIKKRCEELLYDKEVEGLLFKYRHFWGDFDHCHDSHAWYKNEIRIVRNDPEIHSWESAQSFRRIPGFDGIDYRQKVNTYKLKVASSGAEIFHYGWVRPPDLMKRKNTALDTIHKGKERADEIAAKKQKETDYGPLNKIPLFKGTHPAVMKEWIARFDWEDKLQYSGEVNPDRETYKHERMKYKILTFLENNFLGGRSIGGFKNYKLLNK
ncbi:MAG: hypothetical protein A2W91_09710 [Bacteroidetes bacterium GWF2_38_335]|nr:MAG: hypothetical protein A2W91_09710 [Bacteroidetes bacterium GWF2_38_335]OFY78866.1 MAG: hypothetical protein A2281_14045 [Bacteroidetes bacterium RIFOXYA12_FULL_38_20]HBS86290.1 hypothetical protein [Bacteroidales bacterium]